MRKASISHLDVFVDEVVEETGDGVFVDVFRTEVGREELVRVRVKDEEGRCLEVTCQHTAHRIHVSHPHELEAPGRRKIQLRREKRGRGIGLVPVVNTLLVPRKIHHVRLDSEIYKHDLHVSSSCC